MRLRSGAGVLVVAGALLLAACGGGPKSPSSTATTSGGSTGGSSRSSDSITISNFMFSPMSDTVAPGATIRVTNKDSATHTLTATGGQFNTGNITQNQTKTFKAPTKPGTYNYICNIHQYMMGTITVR
jgi:plastocyanin